jgi:hypothetical protein
MNSAYGPPPRWVGPFGQPEPPTAQQEVDSEAQAQKWLLPAALLGAVGAGIQVFGLFQLFDRFSELIDKLESNPNANPFAEFAAVQLTSSIGGLLGWPWEHGCT